MASDSHMLQQVVSSSPRLAFSLLCTAYSLPDGACDFSVLVPFQFLFMSFVYVVQIVALPVYLFCLLNEFRITAGGLLNLKEFFSQL